MLTLLMSSKILRFSLTAFISALSASDTAICSGLALTAIVGIVTISLSSLGVQAACSSTTDHMVHLASTNTLKATAAKHWHALNLLNIRLLPVLCPAMP